MSFCGDFLGDSEGVEGWGTTKGAEGTKEQIGR